MNNVSKLLINKELVIHKAYGNYIEDIQGKKYLDLVSTVWNTPLGHIGNALLRKSVEENTAADTPSIWHFIPKDIHVLTSQLEERFPNYDKFHFTLSGSDAVETSLKAAWYYFKEKRKPRKKYVISFNESYHGITLGALSATGENTVIKDLRGVISPCFIMTKPKINFLGNGQLEKRWSEECGSFGDFKNAIDKIGGPENVAAFIYEPVLGSMGVYELDKEYLGAIYQYCADNDIVTIADEVTTGLYRSGELSYSVIQEVVPDILLLSKTITNGAFPFAVVMLKKYLTAAPGYDYKWRHSLDYHPIGARVASDVLERIEKLNNKGVIKATERKFAKILSKFSKEHPGEVQIRQYGLMIAIEFLSGDGSKIAKEVFESLLRQGYLTNNISYSLCLMPPFAVSSTEISGFYRALTEAHESVGTTLEK